MNIRQPKWDKEKNDWLFHHQTEGHKELYKLFCIAFPDVITTETGVANQRSRIGACKKKNPSPYSRKAKPLYTEQLKGGYVYIKIAQPSVWISKSKWVWCETHPWLYYTVRDNDQFIFLDGNTNNFNPENIEKVSRKEICVINGMGKLPKNNPDEVMYRIIKARLKLTLLDKAEKYDMVSDYGAGRKLKSERVKDAQKYYYKKKLNKNDNTGQII